MEITLGHTYRWHATTEVRIDISKILVKQNMVTNIYSRKEK